MKTALLTILVCSLTICLQAQTNIFPSSGNVGIGTTNVPNNKLQIADGTDDATPYGTVQIIRPANPTDNKLHLCFIRNGQMWSGIGYANGTSNLGIWMGNNTSQVPLMSFSSNQNVGIGTNSASSKLMLIHKVLVAY